jgi:hypothetical protein
VRALLTGICVLVSAAHACGGRPLLYEPRQNIRYEFDIFQVSNNFIFKNEPASFPYEHKYGASNMPDIIGRIRIDDARQKVNLNFVSVPQFEFFKFSVVHSYRLITYGGGVVWENRSAESIYSETPMFRMAYHFHGIHTGIVQILLKIGPYNWIIRPKRKGADDQMTPKTDIQSGCFPSIFEGKANAECRSIAADRGALSRTLLPSEGRGGFNVGHIHPRALIQYQQVPLPLHNTQLSIENGRADNADYYQSKSEQADTPRPLRHHPFINWVLRCVFLGATAAAVLVAFKSAEYADDHESPLWWIPLLGFLALAFWFAWHAVSATALIS